MRVRTALSQHHPRGQPLITIAHGTNSWRHVRKFLVARSALLAIRLGGGDHRRNLSSVGCSSNVLQDEPTHHLLPGGWGGGRGGSSVCASGIPHYVWWAEMGNHQIITKSPTRCFLTAGFSTLLTEWCNIMKPATQIRIVIQSLIGSNDDIFTLLKFYAAYIG